MKKTFTLLLVTLAFFVNAQTPQTYKSFNGSTYNLYAWNGTKTMVLSASNTLDATVMQKWTNAMDGTYNYNKLCTGQDPTFYTGVTYINNRSTIARVPSTCGAGCGYIGWTGIELLDTYFDNFYTTLANNNKYSQEPFYEFGRNFWFYSDQLQYKNNDPIVTGYAVFMRFMAMDYQNLSGANFNSWTYAQFEANVKGLLNSYMADSTLNWNNTLGAGSGVPNSGLGATDLFASFCWYLKDTYGENWVENVWKYAAQRPAAATTQDAVDNFIIASSQAAHTNLIPLFTYWKWYPSANATTYLNNMFSVSMVGASIQGSPLNTNTFTPTDGSSGKEIDMNTSDGINYSLSNIFLSGGSSNYNLKFRQNHSWSTNWGSNTFPTGTGVQNGADIVVSSSGIYNITFNSQTGAYAFSKTANPPTISIIGQNIGTAWTTDVDMSTTDGVNYTLSNYTLSAGDLKFRQGHSWTVNWGNTAFPSGTGVQDGSNIPATAGVWNISLNRVTGAYSFTNSMGTDDSAKNHLIIYHNPTRDILNFSEEIKSASIYSSEGRKVKENIFGKSTNVFSLAKGVYIIKGTTLKGKDFSQRLIKN